MKKKRTDESTGLIFRSAALLGLFLVVGWHYGVSICILEQDMQVGYNRKNHMKKYVCKSRTQSLSSGCSRVEIIFFAGGAKDSSAEFEWSVHAKANV